MSQQPEDLLEFDVYCIDVGQRVLLSRGTPVPLGPKVFDTLLALAEEPGRVLEKDYLLKKIWPETFVEEGNLARNVSTLRRVLG
jgi:DNA-binding winged helix-turn-helix (wHTH) protein